MRTSEWLSFRRCLAIVQRLRRGSASSAELIEFVCQMEGEEAYSGSQSAREKAFKHDRESLRSRLGVEFDYSPATRQYTLTDTGAYFQMDLSETSIRALALLIQTFEGGMGEHSEIQDFLNELIGALSMETRRNLEHPSVPIDLNLLQNIDPNGIPRKVWEAAWRAVKGHRKLCFNYISPAYADQKKRYHEVLPYRIQYQWGHWYLRAYRLLRRDVDGVVNRQGSHLRYRLSYLQDDEELAVAPQLIQAIPTPPRYLVHYRLLPPLSRGAVSQHFVDTKVTPLPDGSVEITGYCEDEWEAGRVLLSYGEYCLVLGGAEVKAWVEKTIKGLLQNYPALLRPE